MKNLCDQFSNLFIYSRILGAEKLEIWFFEDSILVELLWSLIEWNSNRHYRNPYLDSYYRLRWRKKMRNKPGYWPTLYIEIKHSKIMVVVNPCNKKRKCTCFTYNNNKAILLVISLFSYQFSWLMLFKKVDKWKKNTYINISNKKKIRISSEVYWKQDFLYISFINIDILMFFLV